MNRLQLSFEKKEYPYADEHHDPDIRWGIIRLGVYTIAGQVLKNVLDTEWDFRSLLSWLSENKLGLMENTFPQVINSSSIAEAIFYFYQSEGDLDDDQVAEIYEYRTAHGIRFALGGTNIADVYIGKNGDQQEISFFNGGDSWCYSIDLSHFFAKIDKDFKDML